MSEKFTKFMNENSGTASGRVPDDWQPPPDDETKMRQLLALGDELAEAYANQLEFFRTSAAPDFKAGYDSRDAEVAELREDLDNKHGAMTQEIYRLTKERDEFRDLYKNKHAQVIWFMERLNAAQDVALQLYKALSRTRGQWFDSVSKDICLAALTAYEKGE